ncbi:longitudinals lacking protein, isoforms A/B/D/L-like [Leptopilina boulardi]|uniref:longitudinals lacking protein, isoforms A/B/D/L-like n=1 Tax=Leptopilina boulardi TaxID=63433 RepID=UPI0021F51BCC|nr:longitudinals lacking protein, isoforms A/B/D/L-like [Leptopilina boulardi]
MHFVLLYMEKGIYFKNNEEIEDLPLEIRILNDNVLPFNIRQQQRIVSQVNDNVNYTCSKCGNKYKRARSWRRHEKECGTVPKFQCLICLQRFMRKHHLTRHLRNLHKAQPKIIEQIVHVFPE